MLAKLFKGYSGDGSNDSRPTKRPGRPVGWMGRQNTGTEATGNSSGASQGSKGVVFKTGSREFISKIFGSGQGNEPSSGTRDHNAERQVFAGARSSVFSSSESVRQSAGNGREPGPRVRPLGEVV